MHMGSWALGLIGAWEHEGMRAQERGIVLFSANVVEKTC